MTRRVGDRALLESVSLAVPPGSRWGLVGPTGSGKTLLLRALALLDRLDGGEIRWNGRHVHGEQVPLFRSQVIYLHQRPALLEGTVEDNLRAVFDLSVHRRRAYDRERIVALLQLLGRDDSFLAKHQRNLSGGELQLAALLRAIQLDPVMLLLDEPTSALDAAATTMVESLVATWHESAPAKRSFLWVTHDQVQAARVADRLWQMRSGKLEEADDGRLH